MGIESTILSPLGHEIDYTQVVPELWLKFNSRRKEIPNRKKGIGYGIAISEQSNMMEDSMQYLACVEVESIEIIPAGMKSFILPAQLYANFEKVGQPELAYAAIEYIYGIWLQNSGYERASGFDYEVYDHRFLLGDPNAVATYCLPISKSVQR